MDQLERTEAIARGAMAVCDNRLPDAVQGLFAAWMSLVHAEGLSPQLQALYINTAMLEMKGAIAAFNERHKPLPN